MKSIDRVLDADTWHSLAGGTRATERLIAECAAATDGVAEAIWRADDPWDFAPGGFRVRIAIPALTASSGIGALSELTQDRDIRILRRGDVTAVAEETEAWRAINVALWKLENGR